MVENNNFWKSFAGKNLARLLGCLMVLVAFTLLLSSCKKETPPTEPTEQEVSETEETSVVEETPVVEKTPAAVTTPVEQKTTKAETSHECPEKAETPHECSGVAEQEDVKAEEIPVEAD